MDRVIVLSTEILPFPEQFGQISVIMLFLDEDPTALPIWKALSIPSSERPLLAVTGPEGGWTDRERSMVLAKEKSGQACRTSLGPRILPGRLAPIVVASVLSLLKETTDMKGMGPQ